MVFLSAEWRNLVMLNYEVSPSDLRDFVPRGAELDLWEGTAYVSVVGFRFLNTKLLGMTIPLYRNFEEVNLRFYVRRKVEDEWRRGVVFVKELVPRRAVAALANALYGERYQAVPMGHVITDTRVEYHWNVRSEDYRLGLTKVGEPEVLEPGSEAEFIAEHYWGYTLRSGKATLEYRVDHPPWRVSKVQDAVFEGNAAALYGERFAEVLSAPPQSAFLAEGSAVSVHRGVALREP